VWEVEYTDQYETWWDTLSWDEQESIRVAVEKLREQGPTLGRPFVDTIKGSRHPNMKELRPRRGTFAFSLPSIPGAPPSFSSAAIRPAGGKSGTKR